MDLTPGHASSIALAALGMLFGYAGTHKLIHRDRFRQAVLRIPYLPFPLAGPVATLVPTIEIVAAFGLAAGEWWGVGMALILLLATALASLLAHWRGQRVPCMCFSAAGGGYLSAKTAVRNIALGAATLLAARSPQSVLTISTLVYGAIGSLLSLSLVTVLRNRQLIAQQGEDT